MDRLLILIGIVLGLIFFIGYIVGNIFARQHNEYERKFNYLVMAVNDSEVNHLNYKNIKKLFQEIKMLDDASSSWELEKLDVLERKFRNRFAQFI